MFLYTSFTTHPNSAVDPYCDLYTRVLRFLYRNDDREFSAPQLAYNFSATVAEIQSTMSNLVATSRTIKKLGNGNYRSIATD